MGRVRVMPLMGLELVVAAIASLLAFNAPSTLLRIAAAILVIASVVLVVLVGLRPPTVVWISEVGYRSRVRAARDEKKFVGEWSTVAGVEVEDGLLRLMLEDGERQSLPLMLIPPKDREPLLRDIYDRLNAAHGYQRFDAQGNSAN